MTSPLPTDTRRPGTWAPLRPCRWPGCLRRQAAAYCATHARRSSRNHHGLSGAARGLGAEWQRARTMVIERDGGRCQLRRSGCTLVATTADHILPRSRGGTHDLNNLRAACFHCNSARGDRGAL